MGAGWQPPYPDPLYDPRKEMIGLTESVIKEVAAGANVVIVGRGAGFVLHDRPGSSASSFGRPMQSRSRR